MKIDIGGGKNTVGLEKELKILSILVQIHYSSDTAAHEFQTQRMENSNWASYLLKECFSWAIRYDIGNNLKSLSV